MYIRRTQTRNTTSGERYYTHRLVCSKRIDGKVKQITFCLLYTLTLPTNREV